MKKNVIFNIVLIFFVFSIMLSAQDKNKQEGIIPYFNLTENKIELSRIAQPHQYFDKIGRKAAVMGFENGTFETWIWPWKPLRNFDLLFFIGSSTTPIYSKDIVRNISVTPEATVITFSYESFFVKEIIYIPVNKPGVIILLQVETTEELTIVPGFLPVMQPQWPAGIGGQYSYWDDEMTAYVISASGQKNYFLCGSPLGEQMSSPPAHMFADNPLQFKIQVSKETSGSGFIPIVIAGSIDSTFEAAKNLYKDLWENCEKYYRLNCDYYLQIRSATTEIETPVKKINLAYEWSKVALHNLLVDNKKLGKGLVAGYGLSGGGGRPGFAWYFGGDAFINILAFNSFQDFTTVKDALKFTQKWQRQEDFPIRKKNTSEINSDVGKMAHELSQSDGLIDWWNNYHYGYNHADTTPWYIVAIGDYYRNSGDFEFIKKSWTSIIQAFNWCLNKDSDSDGLMDLKGAGLGVLEFGELVKIHNDIYTQVIYTQALKELINMSEAIGDKKTKQKAEEILPIALDMLEKLFWIEDLQFYSFGANEEGKQVREKSIYSTAALMFKLMNEQHSFSTLKTFIGSDMMTDWGIRNLPINSEYYSPSNYNYGTIWPYTSYLVTTALYNYNFNLQGYHLIDAAAGHIFDNGLGVSSEVFSGAINQKLAEAYHDQGFSISGFMMPLMRGMLGLQLDVPGNELVFSPKLPADWNFINIKNISFGKEKVELRYKKEKDKIFLNINSTGNNPVHLKFSPSVGLGSRLISAKVNGEEIKFVIKMSEQAYSVELDFDVLKEANIELAYNFAPEIFWLEEKSEVGKPDEGLKILNQKIDNRKLLVDIEGLPGKVYRLGVTNPEKIVSLDGANLNNDQIDIFIAGNIKDGFKKHQITLTCLEE